jgi:hypothetical protein
VIRIVGVAIVGAVIGGFCGRPVARDKVFPGGG